MMRYGIDALTAIAMARSGISIPLDHHVVAATMLRSHALADLYAAVHRGEVTTAQGRSLLDQVTAMRIRLLGDRVSRARAWQVAEQLGWAQVGDAEYVAVAQLQADTFLTVNEELRHKVAPLVHTTAPDDAPWWAPNSPS